MHSLKEGLSQARQASPHPAPPRPTPACLLQTWEPPGSFGPHYPDGASRPVSPATLRVWVVVGATEFGSGPSGAGPS